MIKQKMSAAYVRTKRNSSALSLRFATLYFFLILVSKFSIASVNPYFQQELNYHIQVKLDDVKNELIAEETLTYQNNSPNTLTEIYFHLWPNAYKDDNTAFAKQQLENRETAFYYAKPEERGFIDGLDFRVDGELVKFIYDSVHADIGKIILLHPLSPGKKISIHTPFHIKLPSAKISRLGYMGESYMITQWFPKPAVYDANGWHPIPYLDQGEFYSEFGTFEVQITLPKNYLVAATGYLQDSSEINWLSKKAAEDAMATFEKDDMRFPSSDTALKTLHYKASAVHDFAWFADKRFHVLKGEIELPISKKIVSTWTFFTNNQIGFWRHGPEYIRETLLKYSDWIGEYPYDQVSIVDGTITAGTGMEYPMVTVIGESSTLLDFEFTVLHEVGHNWFYGILASNERSNPWMDEGINTFYNMRFMEEKYPKKSFEEMYLNRNYLRFAKLKKYSLKTTYFLSYLYSARNNTDQACTLEAEAFTTINYANMVYAKSAAVIQALYDYSGKHVFDSLMHEFYATWKFKHPQPKDYEQIYSQNGKNNLNWLFDDLLGSTKKLDYKLSSIRIKENEYTITVKNKGQVAAPFTLSGIKDNKVVQTQHFNGFEKSQKVAFPKGKYNFLEIDYPWNSLEINRKNNVIRTHGLFKKVEPFQLQFLGSVQNSERSTINFFPVLGFNTYNGAMAGLAFYNHSMIQKRFEYLLIPLYAFDSKDLNGAAKLVYHWNPEGFLQAIEPQISFKKYAFRDIPFALSYMKVAPRLDFTLRKKNARSPITQKISMKSTFIWEDEALYSRAEQEYLKKNNSKTYTINSLDYNLHNTRIINPFELTVAIEQGDNYAKSSLEAIYHFSYKRRNKSADIRVFGGKFFYENNASALYGFAMSGNNDYMYDNIYLGRNSSQNFYNQQFYTKDGAFKNLTLTANAMNWLLACNILLPAPGKIPLAFYSDFGKASAAESLDYDMGIALVLAKNRVEIYVPIKQSSDLNQLSFAEKIRFVLHFNALNPFELIKTTLN